MKQLTLFLALVGLAATGCSQTRVFGPHARRGGANMKVAQQQTKPRKNVMKTFLTSIQGEEEVQADSEIQLASYGGGRCRVGGRCAEPCCDDTCCGDCCEDTCCGDCSNEPCCGCGDDCCGGCCDVGCCNDPCCGSGCCDDGCCGSDCCVDGGCSSGGLLGRGGGGGCSACGGRGCGVCQRMVGRIASGCCPHSGGYPEAYNFNPSPPTGQVAYPYYTVRGPRDFLRNNPPSIGPY